MKHVIMPPEAARKAVRLRHIPPPFAAWPDASSARHPASPPSKAIVPLLHANQHFALPHRNKTMIFLSPRLLLLLPLLSLLPVLTSAASKPSPPSVPTSTQAPHTRQLANPSPPKPPPPSANVPASTTAPSSPSTPGPPPPPPPPPPASEPARSPPPSTSPPPTSRRREEAPRAPRTIGSNTARGTARTVTGSSAWGTTCRSARARRRRTWRRRVSVSLWPAMFLFSLCGCLDGKSGDGWGGGGGWKR